MSWKEGSGLMKEVIDENVSSPFARKRIYARLIRALQNLGWEADRGCLGRDPPSTRSWGFSIVLEEGEEKEK